MPRHTVTNEYSAPITVAAGDLVQNTGRSMLYVCFATPADDDDAAEIQPGRGVEVVNATAMRVRSASRHGGEVKVIRGV